MNTPLLSGPELIPPQATHALICLHGFGADGNDLTPLAPALKASLGKLGETLAIFCPHGPQPDEIGQGRQWFNNNNWTFRDEPGLTAAARQLNQYLEHISKSHAIPPSHIAVLGFSQGSMTTLHALPSLTLRPSGVISLSGGLTLQPAVDEATPTCPILFLHGLEDDVWPADHTVQSEVFFRQHGYPTQLHLIEGLAHGIDSRTLAHTSLFLQSLWN